MSEISKADWDLISELLFRDVPINSNQQRQAMDALGRMLIGNVDVKFQTSRIPPDLSDFEFFCYMLGHLFLDGKITVDSVVLNYKHLTQHTESHIARGMKWEAAVSDTMACYGVSRSTVARALAKCRKEREAAKFHAKLGPEDTA